MEKTGLSSSSTSSHDQFSRVDSQTLHSSLVVVSHTKNLTDQSKLSLDTRSVPDFRIASDKLEDQIYFHGPQRRENIEPLLKNDGDFLVREKQVGRKRQVILSVCWNHVPHHYMIEKKTIRNRLSPPVEKYFLQSTPEGHPSIAALIWHCASSRQRICAKKKVILCTPISKLSNEVCKDDITFLNKLGEGRLGEVWKCVLQTKDPSSPKVNVAVKLCLNQQQSKRSSISKLRLNELKLQKLAHPNLVKFIGMCSNVDSTLMLISELIQNTTLKSYLQSSENQYEMTLEKRLRFSSNIAAGMEYLELKRCIHINLTAQNCLVQQNTHLIKISEFELDRLSVQFLHTKRPVRWWAPECLTGDKYTIHSSVWSFGVVLWEIFSSGQNPFEELSNKRVVEAVTKKNYILEAPLGCPSELTNLMEECWQYRPSLRPQFSKLNPLISEIYHLYNIPQSNSSSSVLENLKKAFALKKTKIYSKENEKIRKKKAESLDNSSSIYSELKLQY